MAAACLGYVTYDVANVVSAWSRNTFRFLRLCKGGTRLSKSQLYAVELVVVVRAGMTLDGLFKTRNFSIGKNAMHGQRPHLTSQNSVGMIMVLPGHVAHAIRQLHPALPISEVQSKCRV